MSDIRTYVEKYLDDGFEPIPIPYKEKNPNQKAWQKIKVTKENLDKHFPEGKDMNVGIKNGSKSGGLVDVDIDDLVALDLAPEFLPATDLKFGRDSNPNSHWLYKCSTPPKKTEKFKSKMKEVGNVIELRSGGSQTVFPPSVHKSGEEVKFYSEGNPASVEAEDLRKAVAATFIATVIVKLYPPEGQRNDFALPFSNLALRLFDNDQQEAKNFVQVVAEASGDEEANERASVVEYTAKKMSSSEPVQGIPTLKQFLPEQAVSDIAKYVYEDQPHDDIVADLNKNYACIPTPPTFSILKERQDRDGYTKIELFNVSAFKAELAPYKVGKKPIAEIWLNSPLRRQYDDIEFKPQTPSNSSYNLFKGFPVPPVKGECELILDHVHKVVCSGNDEYYEYFMGWFANIFKEPEKKPGTCIVLRGEQGCGKSLTMQMFGDLLGPYYKTANNDRYIGGNFNAHFENCLLFVGEEAVYAGNKALLSTFKDVITGNKFFIERKRREPYEANNFVRVAMTTNESWAVSADMKERRIFMLDVLGEKIGDREYFNALVHQYENGGKEALMCYLMHYDYSEIDLRTTPKTEALLDQKIYSLKPLEKWWFETLSRGTMAPYEDLWPKEYGTQNVFGSYLRHVGDMQVKNKSISTQVGSFLKRVCPDLKKLKGSYVEKVYLEKMGPEEKEKGAYYVFPSLQEARKAFETHMGQEIDWEQQG